MKTFKEILTRKDVLHSDISEMADDEGGFDPKRHGLYKAEPSREMLTPSQIQRRAETYIHQYQNNGYKIENVGKNADGSFSFTTTKAGKVVHHTFHKTGGRTQSVGGDVVDHDTTTTDDEVKTQSPRSKPADLSALYKAMGLSMAPPKHDVIPTSKKEKAEKELRKKGGGKVSLSGLTMHRMKDDIGESINLKEEYSEKNPKINLYHKETGQYLASTNWSPTNTHAIAKYEEKNPHLQGLVKATRATK